MQLSEAIILGDPLKQCDPGEWISEDGSCGCAFGGALLAVGVDIKQFRSEYRGRQISETLTVKKLWPWLTEWHLDEISELYFRVYTGWKTIEDVATYVRGIEPAEQSSSAILDETLELILAQN